MPIDTYRWAEIACTITADGPCPCFDPADFERTVTGNEAALTGIMQQAGIWFPEPVHEMCFRAERYDQKNYCAAVRGKWPLVRDDRVVLRISPVSGQLCHRFLISPELAAGRESIVDRSGSPRSNPNRK